MGLLEEYTKWTQFAQEKYGEKSFVCLQGGDFYELLGSSENDPVFDVCRNVLSIRVAQRNRTDGFVAGYPMHSCKSYEAKLLDNGYTVVYVHQTGTGKSIKRELSHVLSPGCHMSDPLETYSSAIMSSIVVEQVGTDLFCSVCFYDANLGSTRIASVGGVSTDVCSSLMHSNEFHELLLTYVKKDDTYSIQDVKNKLQLKKVLVHEQVYDVTDVKKTYFDSQVYQEHALEKFFKHFKTLYQGIFETLNLEYCNVGDIANLIILFEFLESRGEMFTKNILRPEIQIGHDTSKLQCFHKVYDKLQISSNLIPLLNKTKSPAGSRCLKRFIQNPLTSVQDIKKRHDIVQNFIENPHILDFLSSSLHIIDLERIHRSFSLASLKQNHIPKWFATLKTIEKIHEFLQNNSFSFIPKGELWSDFENFVHALDDTFVPEYSESSNIFKPGIKPALDTLFQSHKNIQDELENLRQVISQTIKKDDNSLVQLKYNEKEGFYYTTTHKRVSIFEQNVKQNSGQEIQLIQGDLKINKSKISNVTIRFKYCNELSFQFNELQSKICYLTQIALKDTLTSFYSKYGTTFKDISQWITELDVFHSYAIVSNKWNYVRPNIIENDESSIQAVHLRHPIIEQMNEYIPNTIDLNPDKNILLYGVNSSGKSSLMKSIGIAIIMAQAGMYVSAQSCTITPYHQFFVRMGNDDNIIDGHSSFTCEMKEANTILNHVTPNSLVLADEFCASTESTSATIIVASTLETLALKRATFFFATHLFELIEKIQKLSCLNIKHMKVELTNECLHFVRTLSDGPPSIRNYGTFVCRKICTNKDFLLRLERYSQNANTKQNVNQRSRYNSNIIMDQCALCGYVPIHSRDMPLETHHIAFQCTADSNGFINHFHKNSKHNLVVLCRQCHQNVHLKNIKLNSQHLDTGHTIQISS